MPAWGKVLTEQQIANVAEFVFAHFIEQKVSKVENSDTKANKKKAN